VRLLQPPLLVITDRRQSGRPLAEIVEEICAAGCRWVSLREKDLPDEEQLALASSLVAVVRRHAGARLTVHGNVAVAAAAGAGGVHLPAGADPGAARAIIGRDALVGVSVHSPGEAAAIDTRLVDYVIAGPAFATPSKPGYGPALGPSGIAAIVRASPVPVIAVGGIDGATTTEMIRAGANGVAVMGSIMRADAPATEVAKLLSALKAACRSVPLA
jgi:thiamine-phosphate pyrophosphorylase